MALRIKNKDFISSLYESISSVLGGNNPNQYLCLALPGTIIEPEKYNYDTSGTKPAHVRANESRLVNKMFDANFVTGADNGKMLPNQYKAALSMLSPEMNRKLFELKNQLRKVLMTPYPYDFGEGIVDNMTVEQVFYRLYNDYVEEKSKWSRMQVQKREELVKQVIDPVVREDKYLEWYGTVAETECILLEEKLGRVLNVFSPQDMNVINAILNCGVAGEIEQARSTLSMVEESSIDGGYVYPVSFYPDSWFNLLQSSFTGMDLMESPASSSQRLRTLQMQRKNVLGQISRLVSTIPSDEKMEVADVMPNKSDDYFTQITINTTMSAVMSESSKESSCSLKEFTEDENAGMSIQIGMNVAKVQIERNWFAPGVFQLTKDMFNFAGMQSVPSAFVVAKDVSIKFYSESGVSASFVEYVEKQASKGGGFLCFSANSSSASSNSKSAAVVNSNAKAVTIRFTAPQILGYYMQATPEDKSVHITETEENDMSIVGFISNFKLMMDDVAKSFILREK